MRTERRRLLLAIPAVALAGALAVVLFAFLRAQHALHGAADQVRTADLLPFTLRPLDPQALAAAGPGFEPVAPASHWTSGAALDGNLYLAGPSGLAVFSAAGTRTALFRTGLELPAVPITRVVTGRLRNASGPQVLLATAGAGVLLLTPGHPAGPRPELLQLLPAGPDARDLTALLPTPTGDLLLGTRTHGLLVFNGTDLRPLPVTLPGVEARRLQVTSLASDGTSVLIGTRDTGLLVLHAGVAAHLSTADGLPDPQVDSLAFAGGHAYAGTPRGVAELDSTGTRITRTLAPGLFAHTLAAHTDALVVGTLVVGTLDQGLEDVPLAPQPRLRNASISLRRTLPDAGSEQGTRVDDLLQESPAAPLYALSGGTVLRRAGTGWTAAFPVTSGGLTDPNVAALAFAPDGRLWVGLFDRGLDILNPDLMEASHLEDDALFCINRLLVDPQRGTLAAATANGLVLFDEAGRARQRLTRRDGLISDHINDLAFTPNGLAVATPAGITFLNPDGPASLYAFQGLVNNHVYTLAQSADGRDLLAGTLGGLSLLTGEQVRQSFTATNSPLRHNWITASLAQEPGRWLIGTYGAGLETMTLSPGGGVAFTPVELPSGAPRDLVINPNALLATPTAIYAGTLGHGLLVFTGGRWSLVTRGLPSLNVTAFAARAGQLYLGTDNGLVRIPEQRLAQVTSGGGR